jgi:hypothetical protein
MDQIKGLGVASKGYSSKRDLGKSQHKQWPKNYKLEEGTQTVIRIPLKKQSKLKSSKCWSRINLNSSFVTDGRRRSIIPHVQKISKKQQSLLLSLPLRELLSIFWQKVTQF